MKKFLKNTVIFMAAALSVSVLYLVFIGPYKTNPSTYKKLCTVAESNADVKAILKHQHKYPEELKSLAARNPEAASFVRGYTTRFMYINADLKKSDLNTDRKIPLFLQWDKRWGYSSYNENFMALSGCGPTSVSMAAVYLTGDYKKYSPRKIAKFSEENKYCVVGNGTSWTLMSEGLKKLGFTVEDVPNERKSIFECLENNKPIICHVRKGDFTSSGHYILLSDFRDGQIIINDPNSISKSNTPWEYERIKDQIIKMWSVSV